MYYACTCLPLDDSVQFLVMKEATVTKYNDNLNWGCILLNNLWIIIKNYGKIVTILCEYYILVKGTKVKINDELKT